MTVLELRARLGQAIEDCLPDELGVVTIFWDPATRQFCVSNFNLANRDVARFLRDVAAQIDHDGEQWIEQPRPS